MADSQLLERVYELSKQGFKNFPINERHRVQFRWEMYNATNTPPFLTPTLNINSGNFGRVTSALEAREMQLGLRWQF